MIWAITASYMRLVLNTGDLAILERTAYSSISRGPTLDFLPQQLVAVHAFGALH